MDGASAEQDGLQEDRSHSGPSSLPEAPLKPPGPLVPPDQQDKVQCSTDSPLPLEKEEQVRLQARKWLEEQLKQYRVKRQQERVSLPLPNKLMESFLCQRQLLVPHNPGTCHWLL
uniref:Golgin A3 n=1 Tax=Homo sapiens TaxID=9606 RepID=A0A8I5KQL7_HUMAN